MSDECKVCGIGTYMLSELCDHCNTSRAYAERKPAPHFLLINLNGENPKELWDNLLGLVCAACEAKQEYGGDWPEAISTEHGSVRVASIIS